MTKPASLSPFLRNLAVLTSSSITRIFIWWGPLQIWICSRRIHSDANQRKESVFRHSGARGSSQALRHPQSPTMSPSREERGRLHAPQSRRRDSSPSKRRMCETHLRPLLSILRLSYRWCIFEPCDGDSLTCARSLFRP